MANEGDLEVWWIPQIPGTSFRVPVKDVPQAAFVLDILAQYDAFQYQQHVKPDYCNAGGLLIWEGGEWTEWYDPQTDQDIDEWMETHRHRPVYPLDLIDDGS
jgi:hypothetical protein